MFKLVMNEIELESPEIGEAAAGVHVRVRVKVADKVGTVVWMQDELLCVVAVILLGDACPADVRQTAVSAIAGLPPDCLPFR